jgi:hypothetical protein
MAKLKFANNAVTKLVASLASGGVSISVTPGEGAKFPTPAAGEWFPLSLIKVDGTLEITRCTERVGDLMTIVRAQEGTAALSFATGDRVELRATKAAFETMFQRTGDAMAEDLDMGAKKIKNLADGAAGTDATTKSQMDAAIAAAVASGKNGYGARTVSSSAPSGGADGDIWYQV